MADRPKNLARIGSPPWLWLWLVGFTLFQLPAGLTDAWHLTIYPVLSGRAMLDLGPSLGSIALLVLLAPLWLIPVFGILTVLFPWVRGAYLERQFRLAEPAVMVPALKEIVTFLNQHAPHLRIKVNLLRSNQLAFVYPLGYRAVAIALFGGLLKLWRADRETAEAVLLHEIGHYRNGDVRVVGAGSPFSSLLRYGLPLVCFLVIVKVCSILVPGVLDPDSTPSFVRSQLESIAIIGPLWGVVFTLLIATQTLVLPAVATWCAELSADRFAIGSQGRAGGIVRLLEARQRRVSWWHWLLLRMSHPPDRLRRWFARHSERMGVTMVLLLLFPFALLIYRYDKFGYHFLPSSISLADIKTEFANDWTEQSDDMVVRLIELVRLWLLFATVILIWPFITALAERFYGAASEARRFFSWPTYKPYFFSAMILAASFGLIGMRSPHDVLATSTSQHPVEFKVVGQSVKTPSYNFRVLDYFVTDRYYYRLDPSKDEAREAYPTYGKFVVVTYSVTNTSPETVTPYLKAVVLARDGNTDTAVYRESTNVHPRIFEVRPVHAFLKLAPQQVGISQFIFDVPADAEVETLGVSVLDEEGDVIGGTRIVDLTSVNHQGPRPEEIVALKYEYINMTQWEQSYELFARESKDQISLQQYRAFAQRQVPVSYASFYYFSSVNVDGVHATIEGTTIESDPSGDKEVRISLETVLEDEGWRVVAPPELIRLIKGHEQSSVDRENVP